MTVIDVATRYLDALVSHDADSVPLAPNARRIDNGKVVVTGADALREIIRREPAASTSAFRWLTHGDAAVVFYDLDADMGGDDLIPAYIGERFTVRDGLAQLEGVDRLISESVPFPKPGAMDLDR